jgi:hypothetical protein
MTVPAQVYEEQFGLMATLLDKEHRVKAFEYGRANIQEGKDA